MFATVGLALLGTVLWNGPGTTENAKGKDRKETRSSQADETVAEILARQERKGDGLREELNVYLRDARRVYVNGKQISLTALATVVGQSRTVRAIIAAEPEVSRERVKEVTQVIRENGLQDVKLTKP